MASFLASWFTFLLAPPPPLPQYEGSNVLALIPDFALQSTLKTALLVALSLGLPPLVFSRLLPALDTKTSYKLAGWVSALVHHTIVVAVSVRCLYLEYAHSRVDIGGMLDGVTWTVAYLANDTLTTALPDALRGQYDYLFHHALSIVMTAITVCLYPPKLLRLAPHLWLCEVSAYGLGLSWVCQKFGLAHTALCRFAEALFLTTFLATRCVNLPVVVYAAAWNGEVGLPLLVLVLWPIVILQFWWAYKAFSLMLCSSAAPAKEA